MTTALNQATLLHKILQLLGGNVASQTIRISSIPVLTRLFAPEDYGQFAIAFSTIIILTPLATLRYQMAIPLARDEADVSALTLLSTLLSLSTSLLVLAGVCVFMEPLRARSGLAPAVLLAIPLGMASASIARILEMRALREQRFRALALSSILGAATSRAGAIGLGLTLSSNPLVLVCMKPAMDMVAAVVLAVRSARSLMASTFSRNSRCHVSKVAARYRSFATYAVTDLLMILSRELPTLLIGVLFNTMAVGFFALSNRAFNDPSFVIGDAVTRALYQDLAAKIRDRLPIRDTSLAAVRHMATLCLFPGVLAAVLGTDIFVVVFGPRWTEAGSYLPPLLPIFLTTFISLPTNALYDSLEEQRMKFVFSVAFCLCITAGFVLGALGGDIHVALLAFSMAGSIIMVLKTVWIMRRIRVGPLELTSALMSPLASTAVLTTCLLLLEGLFHSLLTMAGMGIMLVTVYFFWHYSLYMHFHNKKST